MIKERSDSYDEDNLVKVTYTQSSVLSMLALDLDGDRMLSVTGRAIGHPLMQEWEDLGAFPIVKFHKGEHLGRNRHAIWVEVEDVNAMRAFFRAACGKRGRVLVENQ